jgi:hypothetical protein
MTAGVMSVYFLVAGCQGRAPVTALAARDDTASLFGVGRDRLDWGRVEPVRFEVGGRMRRSGFVSVFEVR